MTSTFAIETQHLVSVTEAPLPEVLDDKIGILLPKMMKLDLLPVVVVRCSEGQAKPRQVHASRRAELELYAQHLVEQPIDAKPANNRIVGQFHYDGPNVAGNLSLHTTQEGSGKVWFARSGPEFEVVTTGIKRYDKQAYDPFSGRPSSFMMLCEDMSRALQNGQADTRLCQPEVYTSHLYPGDSVIWRMGIEEDAWHRFDTDPGQPRSAIADGFNYYG